MVALFSRLIIPVGYMPTTQGSNAQFVLSFCVSPASQHALSAFYEDQASPDDEAGAQCPFAALVAQPALLINPTLDVAVAVVRTIPTFAVGYRVAPPLPALGPPLGARAPPALA